MKLLLGLCAALLVTLTSATPMVHRPYGLISIHPTIDDLRDTVVSVVTVAPDGKSANFCTGTSRGPNTFVTAQHCFFNPTLVEGKVVLVPFTLAQINGKPVALVSKVEDVKDMVIVVETGVVFTRWANMGPEPKQGDRVKWFGTQAPYPYIYREGYVAYAGPEGILIDATVCHGDSGTGIFNEQGQIVGVATRMFTPTEKQDSACVFLQVWNPAKPRPITGTK